MSDDIVERLRDWAGNYEEGSFDTEEMLMREAADEIERQAARIAALEAKYDLAMKTATELIDTLKDRIASKNRIIAQLNESDERLLERAAATEAKLATAVKALEAIRMAGFADTSGQIARATLKEIGGSDE